MQPAAVTHQTAAGRGKTQESANRSRRRPPAEHRPRSISAHRCPPVSYRLRRSVRPNRKSRTGAFCGKAQFGCRRGHTPASCSSPCQRFCFAAEPYRQTTPRRIPLPFRLRPSENGCGRFCQLVHRPKARQMPACPYRFCPSAANIRAATPNPPLVRPPRGQGASWWKYWFRGRWTTPFAQRRRVKSASSKLLSDFARIVTCLRTRPIQSSHNSSPKKDKP